MVSIIGTGNGFGLLTQPGAQSIANAAEAQNAAKSSPSKTETGSQPTAAAAAGSPVLARSQPVSGSSRTEVVARDAVQRPDLGPSPSAAEQMRDKLLRQALISSLVVARINEPLVKPIAQPTPEKASSIYADAAGKVADRASARSL